MKTALITGGAGGLGLALDRQLRAGGWHTVLVDLPASIAGLEDVADRTLLGCDLTDTDQMQALCEQVRAERPSIDLVIYNAGVTQIGALADHPSGAHRKVFDINYFAAVDMARILQPDLRAARGVHLAISSVAGFAPLHLRTSYAASKHALEGFFKSLRSEEKPYGVACLIAAPSFVATNPGRPGTQAGGLSRPGSASDGMDHMTPEAAARIILTGFRKRRAFTPVGRVARLAYLVNRLSPGLYARMMERRFNR